MSIDLPKKDQGMVPREYWRLNFDGASKTSTSGACLVLQSLDDFVAEYALKMDFLMTNNEVEYETLIVGIGLAKSLRVRNWKIWGLEIGNHK